jgi:hypothetical protein
MTKKLTIFGTIIILGLLLTSCGPSAKEKEARRIADLTTVTDSLAKLQSSLNVLNLTTRTPGNKKFIKTAETKFLVNNVRVASEKIEDLSATYSGYVTYSNLQNRESDYSRIEVSRDSVIISKKIIVENQLVLKIPNENLDSLVRKLNKLILFLDYRIVKMDDITFNILSNLKASERLKNYETRQKKHIDTKESKLKETTTAEENILNRQIQADNLQVENTALEDQIKYCTLTIFLYQKPFYYKETQVLPNTDSFKPNLLVRILDAVVYGWIIFMDLIVFLFKIWWLIVLVVGGLIVYKLWLKPKKK